MFSICPSFRPSVRSFICPSVINLRTRHFENECAAILLQIGASGARGNGIKRSTFRVRRSKIKVT